VKDGKIAVGVLGVDHRHIYGMLQGMLDAGCVAASDWPPCATPSRGPAGSGRLISPSRLLKKSHGSRRETNFVRGAERSRSR
jgi:hypothetical protein